MEDTTSVHPLCASLRSRNAHEQLTKKLLREPAQTKRLDPRAYPDRTQPSLPTLTPLSENTFFWDSACVFHFRGLGRETGREREREKERKKERKKEIKKERRKKKGRTERKEGRKEGRKKQKKEQKKEQK